MKRCYKCLTDRPLIDFHRGRSKDGRRGICKFCMQQYKKAYSANNKERILAQQRAYDAVKNPLRKQYFRDYYLRNKQRYSENNKLYREAYPHKHNAKETRRRAAKLERTAAWLTPDDLWLIEQAYELATMRTSMFGFDWHVDHVIPLQGKLVSGLHVPNNLQVIPGVDNFRKHNNFEVKP